MRQRQICGLNHVRVTKIGICRTNNNIFTRWRNFFARQTKPFVAQKGTKKVGMMRFSHQQLARRIYRRARHFKEGKLNI